MAASASPSMPASKKRCWVLMFKEIKNITAVKEAEVLSSFRKRYTSVKNLAFRSPASYDDGAFQEPRNNGDDDGHADHGDKGTACVEVQFTGPQPIEGPAGLLCTLLQGAFVSAHPVQLGRGRKRKIRAGISASPAFCSASAPGSDTSSTAAPRSFLGSSGNFDFRLNRNDDVSSGGNNNNQNDEESGAATRAAKKKVCAAGYDSSGTSTAVSDTASDTASTSTHPDLSSATSMSSLNDFFGGLLEDGTNNASAAVTNTRSAMRLSHDAPAGREQQHPSSNNGDVFSAFRPAFGGGETTSEPRSTANAGGSGSSAANGVSPASLPLSSSHLGRSGSVISVATDDLPKWDDVVRCVDSPSSSSSSSSSCCSSSPSSASTPSSSSGEGHRWPSFDNFGEEDGPVATAANTTTTTTTAAASSTSLPPSNPGLAAGNSYYECKESVMSQEEAVSLFAAAASATTTVATTAAGGVVVSEDALWDLAPDDDDDALFCAPSLERHTSSSWSLVHASAAVVANDNAEDGGDGDGDGDGGNADGESGMSSRATSVAGRQQWQQQRQQQRESGASLEDERVKLPSLGHQISFGWCEEECDFDGRSATFPRRDGEMPEPASSSMSPHGTTATPVGSRCHFFFQGLQSAVQGCELRDLAVRAQFAVDSDRASKVEKMASPLEVDGRGHAHATVTYPSMLEIWPEMYGMASVRVIQVDMVVEIRSRDDKFVYTGPTLKVNYRRPATRVFVSTIPMSRQTTTAGRVSSAHASHVAAELGPRRVSTGNDPMIDD